MAPEKITENMVNELFELLASVDNSEDMEVLFADLCTKNEIEQMTQRLMAAKLLLQGKTYNQVIDATDISSATLSRVSNAVKYGKGYKQFIK
ncbi:MAG: TrpR-related protein YerC/YecD [Clostridia bacterium]|nr:TrpR-related protein YerC/YecD [Clostridia bacterium]